MKDLNAPIFTNTTLSGTNKTNNSRLSDSNFYNFSTTTPSSNIFTLAKAFLSIEAMTNKKLQKLCYYAKAWYLAIYDQNLISESFEAWVHGAVQPVLYNKYKEYGYNNIPQFTNLSEIPEEFLSFSREIFDSYGHLTGDQLEKLNHNEKPWIEARKGLEPWETSNNIISEDDMKEFYRGLM